MRTLGYIAAKRNAVAWLKTRGEDVDISLPLVDVVLMLENHLKISISGDLDKRFAKSIINDLFAHRQPRVKQREPAA